MVCPICSVWCIPYVGDTVWCIPYVGDSESTQADLGSLVFAEGPRNAPPVCLPLDKLSACDNRDLPGGRRKRRK